MIFQLDYVIMHVMTDESFKMHLPLFDTYKMFQIVSIGTIHLNEQKFTFPDILFNFWLLRAEFIITQTISQAGAVHIVLENNMRMTITVTRMITIAITLIIYIHIYIVTR